MNPGCVSKTTEILVYVACKKVIPFFTLTQDIPGSIYLQMQNKLTTLFVSILLVDNSISLFSF